MGRLGRLPVFKKAKRDSSLRSGMTTPGQSLTGETGRGWISEHESRDAGAVAAFGILARMTEPAKRLFLVDAMAHIYRAFYAPMLRMNAPSGMPTKVPFLFNNILKRILKDYRPEYLGIVFDPSGPTFRDKLFEKYKEQRQPMPDEMRVQMPYVKKLCEAMRMPILEGSGFEADDVIGTLALKAANSDVQGLIVSNVK